MSSDEDRPPAPPSPPTYRVPRSLRAKQVLRGEVENVSARLLLLRALVAPLPRLAFSRLRTGIYRTAGLQVGPGTLILGALDLGGGPHAARRLHIGARCMLNTPLFIDLNDEVRIEDEVNIGHHSTLITSSHKVGDSNRRAGMLQTAPVVLEKGCWLAAGVTILPGVTVGHGAIIAAGSVVTSDVPPNTLAGGVPAKVIKPLPERP
jgi:acetyltransferase-like isoleucine patch superfamily enzyme